MCSSLSSRLPPSPTTPIFLRQLGDKARGY
ncbi:hypothetical protein E2C01_101733 [Portunus trituberculatus]|uniref:Uncharacterized protein n=1 Tax=Portunus trituberculatus TaxID=210409 RepID=A0A5B7KKT8_PORTR|nr:hypothetical protein [Portunus trituberculatus]